MHKQKIVIVGGGFAGVKAALKLTNHPNLELTLICPNNDFRYYPTLFKLATGGARSATSIPLVEIFKDKELNILNTTVKSIDRANKVLVTENNLSVIYDKVIFAIGSVTNYFNIDGMEKYSFNIKSQEGAEDFKNHIHQQIIKSKSPDLNYVIVGGGPTGAELAGSLNEYLKYVLKCHEIENAKYHIDLVEAKPYLMPRMNKSVGISIAKRLKKLGIKIYTNAIVQGESSDELMVNNKPIRTHTVVWTAGIANNPFFKNNGFVLMKNGLVAVDAYLQSEPNIYVIGDNANTPFSGMAQTALRDADFVSKNILREIIGKRIKPYKPIRPISVVPVGKNWAAVNWGKINFYGYLGHIIRQFADIRGFSEIEPLPNAIKQLLKEYSTSETCEVCAINQ